MDMRYLPFYGGLYGGANQPYLYSLYNGFGSLGGYSYPFGVFGGYGGIGNYFGYPYSSYGLGYSMYPFGLGGWWYR